MVDHSARNQKKADTKDFALPTVTSIDWNNGGSPLEAWLNQSALPSVAAMSPVSEEDIAAQKNRLTAQEIEEIKAFRQVHITKSAPIESQLAIENLAEEMSDLKPRARVYFRNIADRYPLLPAYLVQRLARANCDRIERLELTRGAKGISGSLVEESKSQHHVMKTESCGLLDTEKVVLSEPAKGSPYYAQLYTNVKGQQTLFSSPICSMKFSGAKKLQRHKRTHTVEERIRGRGIERSRGVGESEPSDLPGENFWTGQEPRRRAESVHSVSSSRNSSLHGYEVYNPEDQSLAVPPQRSASSSASLSSMSPALPPPPVDIKKRQTFICDICGELIGVKRRREWQ